MRIRITKYNPIFRNSEDHYQKNEWTCPSEIGRYFDGKEFTSQEYLDTEQAYIVTVQKALSLFGINKLMVSGFVAYGDDDTIIKSLSSQTPTKTINELVFDVPSELKGSSLDILSTIQIKEGSTFKISEVDKIIKLILRNIITCQLIAEDNTFVHFGYDFYVYIGTDKSIESYNMNISKSIFVEHCHSPYLEQ